MKRRGPAFRAAQLEMTMYLDQANDARSQKDARVMPMAQPARETPPVAVELDELSMALSRLEQTAIGLDQQLEPVKNMARLPPAANSTGQAIATICPMGQRLRELTQRANAIQTGLVTLRDSIEV